MNNKYDLSTMKELTTTQYDEARDKAIKRVQRRIGEKPTRANFRREYGAIVGTMDYIALLIFIAALAVSSTHIVQLMAAESAASYKPADSGIFISLNAYTLIHQVGMIALAELSVILFLVLHNLGEPGRASRSVWTRHLSGFGFLAVVAAVFVFGANFASGINVFIAAIPPLATLGIGTRLESIITESLRRRQDIDVRYTEAITVWETANQEPTEHPQFVKFLKEEIWQKLVSLKANSGFKEAPAAVKYAAVYREMSKADWTSQEPAADFLAMVPVSGTVYTHGNSQGNGHQLGVPGSTAPMPNGNGHIENAGK